jgi:hypothetical protein
VQRNESTAGIVGLKPYDDRWLQVPQPLPRVRMFTRTKTSKSPAYDIAKIPLDAVALCEVPLGLPPGQPGQASIWRERPGQLEIAVDCPTTQLLLVAESYHSGWRAWVDAKRQTVYRVNGDFMGCTVGPGRHLVVLKFEPGSLYRGWLATCFGLSLVSLCFLGVTAPPAPRLPEEE